MSDINHKILSPLVKAAKNNNDLLKDKGFCLALLESATTLSSMTERFHQGNERDANLWGLKTVADQISMVICWVCAGCKGTQLGYITAATLCDALNGRNRKPSLENLDWDNLLQDIEVLESVLMHEIFNNTILVPIHPKDRTEMTVPTYTKFSQQQRFSMEILSRPVVQNDPVTHTFTTEFSTRHRRAMRILNIETYGDICHHTAEDFLQLRNFGGTAINSLRTILSSHGLKLSGD